MALDAATTALLQQLAAAGGPPMHEVDPDTARARMAGLAALYPPGPEPARAEDATVPTRAGSLPVRVIAPASPRGVLLYLHGGGWVVGSPAEHEALGRELAHRTGCTVVLGSYRLAPESPWPAAVEDAWDLVTWVDEHRADLAGPGAPLVVAGDSAGGNLATIVARHARDAGGPSIALQVLVYPVVDHDFDNGSYTDPANQLALNRDTLRWFWDHYVPAEHRDDPDVSPARAEDLAGLPPAVVLTAEHDVLRDEGEAYAASLEAAGVPTSCRRFEGQMHGFFTMVGLLPASAQALDHVATEIDRRLAGSRPAQHAQEHA
ncbi:alpha/beta hydrolase [Nocardioides sp. zg-DK7169]|uniref:alpha/beta hydrolase n=1 Tax=Nocardioides sp. zg-DK7169 TaxID=2736600 RepID=UPI001551FEDA|nr:alpha/beta hydrolase [Nocardioides sp. zg-DK7169]NPC96701.1 alpha/beta hydrolase fold domain-containing protein [Nocardioides sp. zg-DK7169]